MNSKLATRAASGGDHSGCSDEEDPGRSDRDYVKSTRTRRRKIADDVKPSKKLRRRGRLDLMPTMNLDILFHIFSFLYPMDLLNLARTSKDFRVLLLQRSSAAAWKTSRLQVYGLPDCPPDMSEPQYANLNCDEVVRSVSWSLRARYCPHFDKLGLQRTWKGVYPKTPQDEMAGFLEKRAQHIQNVSEHVRQCLEWSQSMVCSRKYELDNLRRNRKDAIVARITEAGYKPELDFVGISRFEQNEKALFKAKTLTTQAWDRMRSDLLRRLDTIRARRIDCQVYDPRRDTLISEYTKYLWDPPPPGAAFDVMPHAADVAEFDPFRDLITSSESTTITKSSFLSAFQQLPDLVSSWRAKIDREFIGQIRFPENHDDGGKQSGSDILHLATSVFIMQSGRDHRLFMYPEVLSQWRGFFCPPECKFDRAFLPGVRKFGYLPWSASRSIYLATTINVFEGTAAIIRASGLDPKTAYRRDMDKLDARFACGKCSSPGRKVVMKWEMAILHSYRMHRDVRHEELEWILMEGDELASVKNYEHKDKPYFGDAALHCTLCQHHIGDAKKIPDIRMHLACIHKIPSNKAKHGTHYIADLNSISVTAVALDSDGKVSIHVDHPGSVILP